MLYRIIIVVFVVTVVMMADARLAGRIKEEDTDTEASKKWPKWLRWLHLEDGLKSMFVQIGSIYKGDKYAWIIALTLSITALFPSFFGKASLYLLISELAAMILIAVWWKGIIIAELEDGTKKIMLMRKTKEAKKIKVKSIKGIGGGNKSVEMIYFIVLELFFAAAAYVVALALGKLTLLPKLFLVGTIGFFIFDRCHGAKNLRRIVAGLTLAAMIVTTGFAADLDGTLTNVLSKAGVKVQNTAQKVVDDAKDSVTANAADSKDTDDEDVDEEADWHYYNDDVQGGDEDDDFNFGPALEGDTPEEVDANFRGRIEDDPALGSGAMAWVDYNTKTRYLGTFYESCEHKWAETINTAKDKFIESPETYANTRKPFFAFLDAAEVTVEDGEVLEDQMYMNPYTGNENGSPDIIVMKTRNHTGKFLVYTWTIKGEEVSVAFRIDCGGQPTDVGEKMGITPQEPSTPSSSSNPNKPNTPGTPGTPGKGDNPNPDTPSNPKYKKDKTKGTQGDKVKPGEKDENTNNPSDPQHSKADTSDGTANGGKTYEETKKDVQDKKDTNSGGQQSGGSGSKSTTDSGGRTTDDTGSKDSGHTDTSSGSTSKDKNDGTVTVPD